MLRTRDEMIEKLVSAEALYAETFKKNIIVPSSVCPLVPLQGGGTWGYDYLSKQTCEEEYKSKLMKVAAPVGVSRYGDRKYYTEIGYSAYQAAEKISLDMVKRKCPYK
jgi:hypothetical protein